MESATIDAGWLISRPFASADIPWVYQVSQDPALPRFVRLPSPYRPEHAVYFVQELAIAGWDSGQRTEFCLRALLAADSSLRAGDLVEAIAARFGTRVHPRSIERTLARARRVEPGPKSG